jgi:DNA-binding response OmpR family regulator
MVSDQAVANVLLVEDDESIGRGLQAALASARYEVTWCRDGASALNAAEAAVETDLIVLDLGLPDADGVDVCRALRARLPMAVIVILTARDAEIDVVVGLESGADDYLTKPIRSTELLARLRAHLRRASATPAQAETPQVTRVGALAVDTATRRVWLGAEELTLRVKEFDLLARLAADSGVALSRATLMTDVWDEHWFGSTKTLDVHVAAVRRILADSAARTSLTAPEIETLRGFGYRLQPADGG